MDKLTCMRAFCEVVREGGFSAAARKLGISKVLVSRNVARLESDIGVRLLQRTTRQMSPTDDGLAYFERCQDLLEELDALESAISDRHGDVRGRLRLAVPSEAFTTRHLLDFFADFARQHPQLELDIALGDRYVDIVEEGFDAAIRIGQLPDSSLIARRLAPMEIMLCASPAYLAARPPVTHPNDITQLDLVLDSNYRGGHSAVFQRGSESVNIRLQGRIKINSTEGTRRLLREGLGVGIAPSFMVSDELATGELVQVLPEWQLGKGGIYVVYSHRKHLSGRVNLLVEGLVEHFKNR